MTATRARGGGAPRPRPVPVRMAALLARSRYGGPVVPWDAIVGHAPAKRELAVVVEAVRRTSVAQRLGIGVVKGVLISGPAGSGKTLLATALAGAVERPVYVVPASEADAATVRAVYAALAEVPCVVVWDEADVFLRARWGRDAPEQGRTVAAFCTALDGVEPLRGPITVALTAESEYGLDPAAIRAGRLTTKVTLTLPSRDERRELWARCTARVPVAGPLDLERAADRSVGMSGADIAAAVLVSLGLGMAEGRDAVTPALLDEAILRHHHVEERPITRTTAQLRRDAVHECGHVLYAALTWGVESLASVTLTQTRHGDGRTVLLDAWADEGQLDRRRIRESAGMGLAGMVAEELVYGEEGVSAGCVGDLTRATRVLRHLAVDLGGTPAIGPVDLDVLEHGSASDRGAEAMRAGLWETVRAEAAAQLAATRALLAPGGPPSRASPRGCSPPTTGPCRGPRSPTPCASAGWRSPAEGPPARGEAPPPSRPWRGARQP